MSSLTSPSPFTNQVTAPFHSYYSLPISTLGMVRPLSTLEQQLHLGMANTPTSGSFVKKLRLTDSQLLRYRLTTKPKTPKSKPKYTVQPRLSQPPSNGGTRPSDTLSYLDPAKLKRKRMDDSFILSSTNWDAHEDPIYGYTRTDFDYKAEIKVVRDVAMHSYKEGTTRTEMGHLKYWRNFCEVRGLRQWRDDHEANSGRHLAGWQREVDILSSFALDTAKIMHAWTTWT